MNYSKVFNNAKWIIVCKVIQSLLQFIVGMLCARYLGPSNYGLINYAASVVAFAIPLMRLGFDATLVHELVENPHKEGEILGTSLAMNVLSSLICIGGTTVFVSVANTDERETILVCFLYSLSVFFAAVEMIQYWFQYKLQSKYSSVSMLTAYVVVAAYRIFLLVSEKSVYWFAVTHSIEYGIVALLLLVIYFKKGGTRFCFSFETAKKMFSRSKHYILASLMLVILQNTDHIMLTFISGTAETGFYSAAITCTTIVQFVYIAVIDSFRPIILENKKDKSAEYSLNVSRLYGITSYAAIAQSAVFTFMAKIIVDILYGDEFLAAVPVLQILTWYFLFSVMGVVRNVWILAEQKQKYLWIINLSGALFNIILNSFLIPQFGASGAAFASLLTQFFANFVLGFIIKPIRENNRLLLQGLNPVFVIKEAKNILLLLKNKHANKIG
ncbi:MAG: flippase [Ruminococcaceae bacterium]|nr:flippase [Oscillospiraceae bacterium]